MKKKIIVGLMIVFAMSVILRGDLLGKIQNIDSLIQQGKYDRAEREAKKLLNSPNVSIKEKESIQNLLNEISSKKNTQNAANTKSANTVNNAQNEIGNIITNALGGAQTETLATDIVTPAPGEDTGTLPVGVTEDVSDGSKFKSYNEYEKAALARRNASTIYQLSQLYFKDGLYERAENIAKKDTSGDIRNLYVVAIASRLTGNYDQSIDYYNRILSKSPGQAEARLGIGISYKSKGEYNKALEYLRSYANSNPNKEVSRAISELNDIIANK
ncbi:MAG: tetratricopeptide repeat protein [Leptotrichiaceae bacterium]|nr:tetratricopeptide repeat protein [Leptotrichiaceae bacterium]MBP6280757.1 tetratricopeptide repeat protein [Leptotrichiaceae bacterium]MBP7100820.1 tetratricopeptide repeat protein [Leptotrichiaceae bacterium]MBP7739432.1 tetratricopeptide repeat protein [Leptotrichiaceae bacterium]MBP9629276.1 tetratricopeptide repeat protein [Leptotrichiaceae bacterium]